MSRSIEQNQDQKQANTIQSTGIQQRNNGISMEKEYSIKQIVVELQYTHRPKKKKEHPRSIDIIQHIKLNRIKKRTHSLILIVTEKALEKNRKPIHDESSYECQKGISTT